MNKKGFTLIEILIYIAIIGVVISGFIAFALSITGSRDKNYVVQEVQANGRMALDLISQKIKAANDVVSPGEGNSGSSLELDMPSPDANLTFSLSNGILNATETGSDPVLVTSDEVNVTNLTFTNLAPATEKDNIRIEMNIEYRNPGSQEFKYSQDYQTSISIRQ